MGNRHQGPLGWGENWSSTPSVAHPRRQSFKSIDPCSSVLLDGQFEPHPSWLRVRPTSRPLAEDTRSTGTRKDGHKKEKKSWQRKDRGNKETDGGPGRKRNPQREDGRAGVRRAQGRAGPVTVSLHGAAPRVVVATHPPADTLPPVLHTPGPRGRPDDGARREVAQVESTPPVLLESPPSKPRSLDLGRCTHLGPSASGRKSHDHVGPSTPGGLRRCHVCSRTLRPQSRVLSRVCRTR